MRHLLFTFLLAPLLLWQGFVLRREAVALPEPAGERRGRAGEGPPLRVLVIGDSAAAGVGVADLEDSLAGRLAASLGGEFELYWELHATTGATTADALDNLSRLETREFDLAVTSLGVNDVTANLALSTWLRQQRELRGRLRRGFGVRQLVLSGLPPMGRFPALPQPLRWYLGRRADDFNRALARDIRNEADSVIAPQELGVGIDSMASDGFHPGAEIYREWARQVADIAITRFRDSGRETD